MGDGLGAVVDVPVLVPPAPIGDVVVLALGAFAGAVAVVAVGAVVEPAGGMDEPIAGPVPPSWLIVCSSSEPV